MALLFHVVASDIPDKRRRYPEFEKPHVPEYGQDDSPNAVSRIAQSVDKERSHEEGDGHLAQEAREVENSVYRDSMACTHSKLCSIRKGDHLCSREGAQESEAQRLDLKGDFADRRFHCWKELEVC